MATLTPTVVTRSGVDISSGGGGFVSATSGGDKFLNIGREFVMFTNLSGAPITVTFDTPGTIDGLAIANRTVSVPSMANLLVGPWQPGIYNDASGLLSMTYSGVTSLTLQVFNLLTPS